MSHTEQTHIGWGLDGRYTAVRDRRHRVPPTCACRRMPRIEPAAAHAVTAGDQLSFQEGRQHPQRTIAAVVEDEHVNQYLFRCDREATVSENFTESAASCTRRMKLHRIRKNNADNGIHRNYGYS